MITRKDSLIKDLQKYFSQKKEVAFAYIFGSYVKGSLTDDSDIDIAVYYYPDKSFFDLEDNVFFDSEEDIWNEIETINKCNTELLHKIIFVSTR